MKELRKLVFTESKVSRLMRGGTLKYSSSEAAETVGVESMGRMVKGTAFKGFLVLVEN